MIQTVVKRDGRIVGFNEQKIMAAIRKAMLHTDKGEDERLLYQITDHIAQGGESQMTVEQIQDLVEVELMKSSRKDVAQKYIAYRHQRSVARKAKTREVFLDIVNIKKNDLTRENANMNADTPAGMMMKFASETTKPFVDDYLLSEESREAVEKNYMHIHDKDYYPTKSLTCVQHPLDNILNCGFIAGHGASRPARRIETASVLACISMECCQNEMHGGQAIPAFDFYLAPYVRMSYVEELKALEELNGESYKDLYDEPLMDYIKKPLDGLTGKERAQQHAINKTVGRVHQAMEAFIHNMNTIHSRGGNQVVFSSINYGTDEDRNFDLYQLACKVTARRFFPNFLNLDATYNQDSDWRADDPKRYVHEVATMGCRTRVFENRFGPKTSIGRGNLSFTTINIVKLAIECMLEVKSEELTQEVKDKRVALFFAKLDHMLEVAAKQLDDRYQFQKTAFAKQFPLLMKSLWIGADKLKPYDTIESVINQGTLGIGFIGGESAESQELGLKIVSYMRQRINDFCEQYHHNYSVLATPAEGLSGKFTKKDRKEFGSIPGVTDRDYYTNSNHVPVYYKCSARHKAEVEAPYHEMTRGGHIFYVEIDGDATHNPQVIMSVVDMMDQLDMGYGSVNHNRNRCMDCGYENADDHLDTCPKCGSKNIDKLQRITGYLVGTTDRWNSGKLAELNDRVTHIDHGTKDLFGNE